MSQSCFYYVEFNLVLVCVLVCAMIIFMHHGNAIKTSGELGGTDRNKNHLCFFETSRLSPRPLDWPSIPGQSWSDANSPASSLSLPLIKHWDHHSKHTACLSVGWEPITPFPLPSLTHIVDLKKDRIGISGIVDIVIAPSCHHRAGFSMLSSFPMLLDCEERVNKRSDGRGLSP